ncbi:MAG: hypothetical protein IJX47_05965 [Clostridia bacterium]|nr:hypothetical protein [Clostridia bacterium]
MYEKEIKKYAALNSLAQPGGIVIFGGSTDTDIPLCELKQAFDLSEPLYNRSVRNLTVSSAAELFDACVADLAPDSVLLHIGEADLNAFAESPSTFDRDYRQLIAHIRACVRGCKIAMISLRNPDGSAVVTEMNQHLKVIAESERCEYNDISIRRVWNPKETCDVISFVHSMGAFGAFRHRRSFYDLTKILFCYESSCAV